MNCCIWCENSLKPLVSYNTLNRHFSTLLYWLAIAKTGFVDSANYAKIAEHVTIMQHFVGHQSIKEYNVGVPLDK